MIKILVLQWIYFVRFYHFTVEIIGQVCLLFVELLKILTIASHNIQVLSKASFAKDRNLSMFQDVLNNYDCLK